MSSSRDSSVSVLTFVVGVGGGVACVRWVVYGFKSSHFVCVV